MKQRVDDSYWSADVWLMGGFSIVTCLALWLGVDRGASVLTVSQAMFALAFVCNHPHFLSSYVLLYGDYRKRVLRRRAYFWAGVVVPALLGATLLTALVRGDAALLANVITGMYFLVGWHYVKQVFGCVIVTSVRRGIYFSGGERRLLLTNLFLAWFMSWLGSHVADSNFEFYGIQHHSLNLPPVTLTWVYAGVAVSFAAVVWNQTARWIRTGQKPSPPAVAAFASLYAWYLPTLAHPAFAYMIPFFHSLQYLAFVWVLKRNQVAHEVRKLEGETRRRAWLARFGGFALSALVLGALSFQFVPTWLDQRQLVSGPGMGTAPILAAVILFINIHHYFIDNVIWRADNETVKQFLFSAAAPDEKVVALERAS